MTGQRADQPPAEPSEATGADADGVASHRASPASQPTAPPPLRTPLTDLLGVRYPIVQAGMGYVAGARLAAATSAAGGLGIIAATTMSPQRLRRAIEEVRSRTSAPFGVNFRADATNATEVIDLIIANSVPVASFAQAPRPDQIARLREAGVRTIASAGARRHAEKAAGWGVDAVIATGCEGGGHVGSVPTSLLIPQVASAIGIPVIAAGGYFDGRGLVAALAYGASGIAMGTRFLLTSDSPVADQVTRVYLASDLAGTLITSKVDGVPHRVLRTPLVERLDKAGVLAGLARSVRAAARLRRLAGAGGLDGPGGAEGPGGLDGAGGPALTWRELIRQGRAMRRGSGLSWAQVLMAANTPMLLSAAMVDGRPDLGLMSSGQVAGLIEDLPTCAELIERIMAQAHECLRRLDDLVKPLPDVEQPA